MKKFVLSTVLFLLVSVVFCQSNSIINKNVPRAGEFIEDTQNLYELNGQFLKGDPGYDSVEMSFQGNWAQGSANDIIS
ncbi:MAG: hypothetical protein KAI29_16840, partial [Cyclobacteriaceae bacterium]|nr:hypothetical protein [Cyclobacteriaceae bacterium]